MANTKYDVVIIDKYTGKTATVDVYRVLDAFGVQNPQLQHLIKKALAVGQRGHKNALEDLKDIVDSAVEAQTMETQKLYIMWANQQEQENHEEEQIEMEFSND